MIITPLSIHIRPGFSVYIHCDYNPIHTVKKISYTRHWHSIKLYTDVLRSKYLYSNNQDWKEYEAWSYLKSLDNFEVIGDLFSGVDSTWTTVIEKVNNLMMAMKPSINKIHGADSYERTFFKFPHTTPVYLRIPDLEAPDLDTQLIDTNLWRWVNIRKAKID